MPSRHVSAHHQRLHETCRARPECGGAFWEVCFWHCPASSGLAGESASKRSFATAVFAVVRIAERGRPARPLAAQPSRDALTAQPYASSPSAKRVVAMGKHFSRPQRHPEVAQHLPPTRRPRVRHDTDGTTCRRRSCTHNNKWSVTPHLGHLSGVTPAPMRKRIRTNTNPGRTRDLALGNGRGHHPPPPEPDEDNRTTRQQAVAPIVKPGHSQLALYANPHRPEDKHGSSMQEQPCVANPRAYPGSDDELKKDKLRGIARAIRHAGGRLSLPARPSPSAESSLCSCVSPCLSVSHVGQKVGQAPRPAPAGACAHSLGWRAPLGCGPVRKACGHSPSRHGCWCASPHGCGDGGGCGARQFGGRWPHSEFGESECNRSSTSL